MENQNKFGAFILGAFLFAGLALLGFQLSAAFVDFKQLERSVTVKGLSEKEYPADIVIWPIQFTAADNNLQALYENIDTNTRKISEFLAGRGIPASEISFNTPSITDKSAQQYGNSPGADFRYTALQTVTVYSSDIDTVRATMRELSNLGKQGIVFTGNGYQAQTEYLFTRLNEIKPQMIEEATREARQVAEKFATDSNSRLGKIKTASQGQFSISDRDQNNPHIKKIRVVSTIEYYLSD